MKILGKYKDKRYWSLYVNYDAQVALKITSAMTEGYSDREDETKFFVKIRSGCYIFHILTTEGKYYSKDQADELIRKIVMNDVVILDDIGMALYEAKNTTPDEYYVRNALDEDYNEIPLSIISSGEQTC